ncbi:MAG: S-methyl-5'-thioadenosine phosphorylase [Chloroflexi bacterium ADurb.Bin180]|nr:MAG: S-methyl-5'-thioadenosine phosphorylase [Chloroflexi bacterium ADurb.Bin180]HOU24602.1 S-methyl-5'-thioadenosine phosphorylase [Anaerolineae bacterium]
MQKALLGIIGGSGVYDMEGLTAVTEERVSTPYGDPSDAITVGTLSGTRIAFLPRHGRGHRIMPAEVNSRANIYALKSLGVEYIVSISACGSMREDFAPRSIVIPDQIFDRTKCRPNSFFGNGLVVHISFDEPYCPTLSDLVFKAVKKTGATVHKGGTFLVIDGPQFSTKAESRIYRQWGVDIIGMTAIPEAKLAREAEICYAAMAHVTDYDVWHETEEPVTVAMLIENLQANAAVTKRAVQYLAPMVQALHERSCKCASALSTALITDRASIPAALKQDLALLLGKYL